MDNTSRWAGFSVAIVIVIVILLLGSYYYIYTYAPKEKKTRSLPSGLENKITVEVKDSMCHYKQERIWSEKEFQQILEDEERFKEKMINDFKGAHKSYGITIRNCNIQLDKDSRITTLECDVEGFVYKSDDSYTAEFGWLIRPLGLDFIDNKFNETNDSLSWSGVINGTKTFILVRLPPMDKPYAAWGQPNGHCHAHVWWEG